MIARGYEDTPTLTPPLRQATLVIYLATAFLLFLFPLSLSNWLDDKDWSTVPVVRTLVLPAVDLIASLGPADWDTAVRARAKEFMRRPE